MSWGRPWIDCNREGQNFSTCGTRLSSSSSPASLAVPMPRRFGHAAMVQGLNAKQWCRPRPYPLLFPSVKSPTNIFLLLPFFPCKLCTPQATMAKARGPAKSHRPISSGAHDWIRNKILFHLQETSLQTVECAWSNLSFYSHDLVADNLLVNCKILPPRWVNCFDSCMYAISTPCSTSLTHFPFDFLTKLRAVLILLGANELWWKNALVPHAVAIL